MRHQEYKLQVQVVKLLRAYNWVVFSIPNERNLGIADSTRMKAAGLTKGAPDLVAWEPTGDCWWLELKTPQGRRSPEQECSEFVAEQLHINYRVVRDLKDVENIVRLRDVS